MVVDRAVGRPPRSDVLLLSLAILAISTSGPLIAAAAAPALAIAFWRCVLGGGLTAAFSLLRKRSLAVGGRELRLLILSGLLLGAHFATWIPSLRFTSVASSTALVATQPIWAALFARIRGAYVPPLAWVGILISLVGVVVLAGTDFSLDPTSLGGDALALAGAVLAAAYVTVGEQARKSVSTIVYTAWCYSAAGLGLLAVCIVASVPLSGFSARDWLCILGLTLGAQLLGHSLVNRVLATTSATVVSLAILFEMPLSTLLAALWLDQIPPPAILPAVLLLFSGVWLVLRSSRMPAPGELP